MTFGERGGPSPEEMGISPEEMQTPEAREKERDYKELSSELGRTEALVQAVNEKLKDPDAEARISKLSAAARNRLIEWGTTLSTLAAGATGGILLAEKMAGGSLEHAEAKAVVVVALTVAVAAQKIMSAARYFLMENFHQEEYQEALEKGVKPRGGIVARD